MDINYYKKFEPIDGKWHIVKELGSGAFGTVFEVERRDFSQAKSALKVITIPSSPNEVNSYREDNYDLDEQSISSYFYGFVEEFTDEFKLMTKLRGNSNIVSIEDYDVIEHKDEIGWDIFIRMELLTPMNKYFRDHELSQRDIIKLGIDICKALEVCQKYKIIHRDIKPSNIFVSDTGEFKLGDFGIARTLEKTSSGLSKKGTYTYMAPEVHVGGEYGSNVDIYSLGIVMYKLLNNNFEPFRTQRTHNDEEEALTRRLKGEKIPKPANADGRLAEIVLKACSFNPKERYESPLRMREELENILYSETEAKVIYPNGDEVEYEASTNGSTNEKTVSMFGDFTVADVEDDNPKTMSIFDSDAVTSEEILDNQVKNKIDEIVNDRRTENDDTAFADSSEQPKKKAMILGGIILAIIILFAVVFSDINQQTIIHSADISLENFVVGETLNSLNLISDNPSEYSATITKCCYKDDKTGEEVDMQSTDVFEQDKEYYIYFEYIAMDGYKFVDYIDFKVEGVGIPRVEENDDPVGAYRKYTGYAEEIALNEVVAEPAQTENSVKEPVSHEQPTTTKPSQNKTTSNQNTVKKCSVCGSTSHTSHPTCPTCGSTAHTKHPTCPVCGSTSHTSHPIELPKENTQAPPSIPYYE